MPDATSSLQSKPPQLFTPIEPPKPAAAAAKPKPPAVDLDYQPSLQSRPLPVFTPAQPTVVAPGAVAGWPDAMLEHNAKSITKRLLANPASVGEADRALLKDIEAEVMRRDAAAAAAKKPATVQLCERPADLPGNDKLGVQHWWLKTPNKEVGMGPAGGGIPGKKDGPSGYPGVPTTLNDHTGEGGPAVSCQELPDVDVGCVDEELAIGKPTGRWLPPFNDCHTAVQDVIDKCKKPGTDPWVTKALKDGDAGVP